MRTSLKVGLFLVGAALLGVALRKVGLREVWSAVEPLGARAPWLLVPYLAVYLADCIGWRWTLPRDLGVPFPRLFLIRWAGEAVNNVVPSGYVGGEAVKVFLLRRDGVPAGVATGAAVVSKSAQTAAQLLFICVASVLFLRLVPDEPAWRRGLTLVLVGGVAALSALFWIQARGVFATVRQVTGWLRWEPRWLRDREPALREVDAGITGFYRGHPRRFAAATAGFLGGWLLDATEIWLAGRLLGQPLSWMQAVAVEGFVGVVKVLGMWVPGAVGVQEGGIVLLGRAVGLPEPFCLAYALLRRVRELLFAGVGWGILAARHVRPSELRE
jgi:putative membrane protein